VHWPCAGSRILTSWLACVHGASESAPCKLVDIGLLMPILVAYSGR
jgi:hypothetical protein